jgi:lipoprotein-anchoring transpeptidase ErfK/SrfK
MGASGVFQLPDSSTLTLTADGANPSPDRGDNRASRGTRTESAPPSTPDATPTNSHKNTPPPPSKSPSSDPGKTDRPEAGTWPLPENSGEGKRIVYDLDDNYVWLVDEDNEVKRSYLVSGTKFGQLKTGTYEIYKKRLHTTSYHGIETMNYMVSFYKTPKGNGIGFHDIPEFIESGEPVQTLDQLGTSLSDGCVRQARPDAKALWEFSKEGMEVVVV